MSSSIPSGSVSAKTAGAFLRRLGKLESWLCTLAFAVMALLLFSDVVLRTLLGNGLPWSLQASVYANMVVSLIGIGLASARGSHLRPRFADHWLPLAFEPIIRRLQPLTTALVMLFFASLSLQLVIESYQLQEVSSVLRTAVWPVQCLLPLAFFTAVVRYSIFVVFPDLQSESEAMA